MTPLLHVQDLRVHFPTAAGVARAVDGISFTLQAGRTLGLVGESGCGKSVTAAALLRLLPSSAQISGAVDFEGVALLQLPEGRMRSVRGAGIGLIFQEPVSSLNPIFPLGSQIAEVVRVHQRIGRRAAWNTALDLLRAVQIRSPERVARQYPHQVSGGMAQRVAIALALAGQPRLLIADEPTTALDTTVQAEILTLLRRLRQEHGMAMLLITHDLDVVAEMAEDVAVMYTGKIVEQGPLRRVFQAPLHPYTAGLLACRPRLGCSGRLASIEGVVPPATHWPQGCRFRERCPFRDEQCLQEPPLQERGPEHAAACWHWQRVRDRRA
jgi:peptide/nickel transport system ATP-binding protein